MSDALIAALSGAKTAGMGWARVAELLRRGLERERREGLDPKAGRFLGIAADATGYSRNLLYRFLAVRNFVDEKLVHTGLATVEQLGKAPFASVELIKRVWGADPKFAGNALRQVLEGKITVRQLQSKIRSVESTRRVQDPRVAAFVWRMKTERQVIAAIKDRYVEILSGTKDARFLERQLSMLRYADVDLAIVIEDHGRIEAVDGVEVVTRLHAPIMQSRNFKMTACAVSSTFYRRFWYVVLSSETHQELPSGIQRAVAQLSLNNVGVAMAAVAKNGNVALRVIRSPAGPPVPDRQPQLIETLRRSLWQELERR